MNLLDLFSGIGGFSLGFERAGFQTVAFCECEPFPRRVLAHHWPDVPIYPDVRELTAARLRADGIERVDAICGGFPCQDISLAGAGAGLDGERSGLWREFARLIGELRPAVAIVENVGALRARGLARVLGDLAALGYDAEWHAIPAAAVGAPHLRDRVWIVASAADADSLGRRRMGAAGWPRAEPSLSTPPADTDGSHLRIEPGRRGRTDRSGEVFAGEHGAAGSDTDADSERRQFGGLAQHGQQQGASGPVADGLGARGRRRGPSAADPERNGRPELRGLFGPLARALAAASAPWPRTTEPPLCGLDDGLPARLARPRLKALGNAVVPQIPELIGRAVLEQRTAA